MIRPNQVQITFQPHTRQKTIKYLCTSSRAVISCALYVLAYVQDRLVAKDQMKFSFSNRYFVGRKRYVCARGLRCVIPVIQSESDIIYSFMVYMYWLLMAVEV